MREASGGASTLVVLPLLLGVATLVLRATLRGRRRGIGLFIAGGIAWVIVMGITSDLHFAWSLGLGRGDPAGILLFVATLAATIAAGNRLRKACPSSLTARLLAGVSGSLVLLFVVLPVGGLSEPAIAGLFNGDVWRYAPEAPLFLLLLIAYATLGAFAFRRPDDPGPLTRGTSIVGRFLLAAPVAAFVIGGLARGEHGDAGTWMSAGLKASLVLYGFLAVLAVGFVAWVADVLVGARGPAGTPAADSDRGWTPPPPPPSAPAPAPSPDVSLGTRLAALDRARDAGLLTPEEYAAKRRQIVDEAKF